jgi:RIO-like serine/threonine protein kinase
MYYLLDDEQDKEELRRDIRKMIAAFKKMWLARREIAESLVVRIRENLENLVKFLVR